MSRPSTGISAGGFALFEPVTLICICTGCPIAVSELLSTAVTVGVAASNRPAGRRTQSAAIATGIILIGLGPCGELNMGSRRELLPVLIDMACRLAFIELHALLFVFHRL